MRAEICTGFVSLLIISLIMLAAGAPAYAETYTAVPNVPTNVMARGISSMEAAVNWSSSDQASGYRIFRSTKPDSDYVQVGETSGQTETYFLDKDLEPGNAGIQPLKSSRKYYYKVAAFNPLGQSDLSANCSHTYTNENNDKITVLLNCALIQTPEAPRGLTPKPGPNRVEISWNPNRESNIEGYNVYRAEISGATQGTGLIKLNNDLIKGTDYTDLSTANYFDYYYRVSAVVYNDEGVLCEGPLSPEKFIRLEEAILSNVPHLAFSVDSSACATCHTTHSAEGPKLINSDTEPGLCFTCHDGTGSQHITYQDFVSTDSISKHPVAVGENEGTLGCNSCHNPHLDFNALDGNGEKLFPKILEKTYNDIKYNKGNELCYACHGLDSVLKGGDHQSAFQDSVHNTAMPEPVSGTETKCSSCHLPHAASNENLKPYKEENMCFSCHYPDAPVPGKTDIYTQFYRSSGSGARHDIVDGDQAMNNSKIECHNCHNPHGLNSTYVNTNPDNPAPDHNWTGTVEPSEIQPKTGTINEFCLKCHDETYTSDGVLEPYAPDVTPGIQSFTNIDSKYYGERATDAHGIIDGHPNTLDPSMGYDSSLAAPNYILACTRCHEPHGSLNEYKLRTAISSIDESKEKKGLLTYTWSYIEDGGVKKGTDARFFCNGCHNSKNMGNNKNFPTDCFRAGTGCHGHGQEF